MKEVLVYIRNYFRYVNKKILVLCTLQTAVLVFLNYQYKLEWWLTTRQSLAWPGFTGHYILFAIAFTLPYFYYSIFEKRFSFHNKPFIILLVMAPAIFSLK